MSDSREQIRSFLGEHVGDSEFADDADIFASGWVNSLFAVQLVLWLERQFAIQIAGPDLVLAHFRSVDSIADFVEHKLA